MARYENVYQVRLSHLAEARDEWKTAADVLRTKASDARLGMRAKAEAARWSGENENIARPFVMATADRFEDGYQQARSVHNILDDLHTALYGAQKKLKRLEVEASEKRMYVERSGRVIARDLPPGSEVWAEDHRQDWGATQEEVDAMAASISAVLVAVDEADAHAAEALLRLAGEDEDYYTGISFAGLGQVGDQLSVEAADEALAMYRNGDLETDEGLRHFDSLLAEYGDDETFAERFATGLGAEGTLTLWADLLDPHMHGDISEEREKRLNALHKNLGVTLGLATQSESGAMVRWQEEMIGLGAQRIGSGGSASPYGFQTMSSLMTTGTYHPDFLQGYGNALISFEQDMQPPGSGWRPTSTTYQALLGEAFHWDPMSGYMQALSRTPDAATDIFIDEDTAQYLLKDRPYDNLPPTGGEEGGWAARHAIGDALHAASTGIDPNDPDAAFIDHTPMHRRTLIQSLELFAEMGDDLPYEYREPMARILANHGTATHETMSDVSGNPPFDARHLQEVAKQLFRDQDAHAILNVGLNQAMVASFHDESIRPEDSLDAAGQTIGYLEKIRYQAIELDKEDPTWEKHWRYHGPGALLNALPVIGDVAQRGADIASSAWLDDELARIKDDTEERNREIYTERKGQISTIGDAWYEVHKDWAQGETGYSEKGAQYRLQQAVQGGKSEAAGREGETG